MKQSEYGLALIGQITLDDVYSGSAKPQIDQLGGDGLYSLSGAFLMSSEPLCLMVRKGNDLPLERLKTLTKERVDYRFIRFQENTPNIHLLVLFDRYQNRYFIPQRWGGKDEQLAPRCEDFSEEFFAANRFIHIAPFPIEYSKDTIAYLLKHKRKDACISVDPHFDGVWPEYHAIWNAFFKDIDIWIPSEDELLRFFSLKRQDDLKAYFPYLKEICQRGVKICVCKLGERGVIAYDSVQRKAYYCPCVPGLRVVDVTGCGDAFCGGFMADYSQHQDLYHALVCGSVAASFTLEHYGVSDNFAIDAKTVEQRLNDYLETYPLTSALIEKED